MPVFRRTVSRQPQELQESQDDLPRYDEIPPIDNHCWFDNDRDVDANNIEQRFETQLRNSIMEASYNEQFRQVLLETNEWMIKRVFKEDINWDPKYNLPQYRDIKFDFPPCYEKVLEDDSALLSSSDDDDDGEHTKTTNTSVITFGNGQAQDLKTDAPLTKSNSRKRNKIFDRLFRRGEHSVTGSEHLIIHNINAT